MTSPTSSARRPLRWVVGAVAVLALLLYARAALWRPLALVGQASSDGYVRVRGVVHVHTTHSDGGGTPDEVVAAARAAGLDFVFITDHNTLDAKPVEGYHDRLLVGVGSEISTVAGHVVALGLPRPALRFWGDVDAALDDVRALGGVAFAAHVDSPRPDLRWTAWSEPGPWGIEVFNGDSQWRRAGWLRRLRVLALYKANPDAALLGMLSTPAAELRHWDELLARRDVALLAGADAHSRVMLGRERPEDGGGRRVPGRAKRRGWRFPSYAALFRLARNHVLLDAPLTGDAARDVRSLAQALARGRSYTALDALAPGGELSLVAEGADRRVTMGDTTALVEGLTLRAGGRLPAGAELVLLHDGREVARAAGALAHAVRAPGVYRIEGRVAGWPMPWALSNPIYVFDAAQAEARRRAAAWPEPAPPPPLRWLVDGFEGTTIFGPEVDRSSSIELPFVVAAEGSDSVAPQGHGLARVAFHLGVPGPGGPPHPWCALVNRDARDFSGARGLVLALKADGVYRVAVQVRDVNPRGSDDGLETWQTSVRTSTAWRRVALPFARFRSLDPRSDGRLDLGQVRALALVLDDLTLVPGTRGTLWLDELGTY